MSFPLSFSAQLVTWNNIHLSFVEYRNEEHVFHAMNLPSNTNMTESLSHKNEIT